MTAKAPKRFRCAVYERVSTEYGLDQELNSLDAHDVPSHGGRSREARLVLRWMQRYALGAQGHCPRRTPRPAAPPA
jgi:hypothetical protein